MRRSSIRIGALAVTVVFSAIWSPPASAATPAPVPTSSAASPTTPNPHPPLGGRAPDGSVPGGAALDSRGLILPPNAPALPKNLPAQSWVLADLDSGQILAARDPHGRYQPASVLKMLTAITLLPNLAGNRVVTVSPAAATAEGSSLGLLAGAKYTVDELFQALFLVSANDAAAALAEANGGQAKTVADMNAVAQRLGAYDTFVQTPSGLDGWQQLTSAYDLALVLRVAVNMPRLLSYDQAPSATYGPKKSSSGAVGSYEFDNQGNDFMQHVPGALFSKIGFTDAAEHTYAAAVTRKGRRLGVILLRNQKTPLDQWQQAAELFDWGYALPAGTAAVGTLINSTGPNPSAAANLPAVAAPVQSVPAAQQLSRPAAVNRTLRPHARTTLSQLGHVLAISVSVLLGVVVVLRVRQRLRLRRRRRARQQSAASRSSALADSGRR